MTIGPSEAFTTTLMVAGYFALMVTLPMLLYQLYAFVIPALSRDERRIAVPSMIAAPLLFVAGCVFTYFAIVPPAMHFLQGYNSNDFTNLLQAKAYYKFEIILMMGIGLAFQVPLLLLALQKVGMITASTLTLNWRYAYRADRGDCRRAAGGGSGHHVHGDPAAGGFSISQVSCCSSLSNVATVAA